MKSVGREEGKHGYWFGCRELGGGGVYTSWGLRVLDTQGIEKNVMAGCGYIRGCIRGWNWESEQLVVCVRGVDWQQTIGAFS